MLGLTVGAEVLVPQTPRYLEVAVASAHHQYLFVELWRLRQRVDLAWMEARRYDEVAGALRCLLGEKRRLYLGEALLREVGARRLSRDVARLDQPLHVGTSEVQIAVLQTQFVARLHRFLEDEGWCQRRVQNDEFAGDELYLACGQVRIEHALGTFGHLAANGNDVLRSELPGLRVQLLIVVRAEDHLCRAVLVSEVDEEETAQITAAVDPSHQHGLVSRVFFLKRSAGVRSSE